MKYPCENCKLRAAYDKGGVRNVDNIVEGTIRSLTSKPSIILGFFVYICDKI
jgi:ABC-type phosphate transport system permease subunit